VDGRGLGIVVVGCRGRAGVWVGGGLVGGGGGGLVGV